jgi:hypothetical protein
LISSDLKDAKIDREALHIKRQIAEIGDEEYSLKLSVADWTINDLKIRLDDLEKCVNALDELGDNILTYKDENDLYQISKNSYESIKCLEIESHVKENLIYTLSQILDLVVSTNFSTI